ncbi:hypothetical protein [Helicobacter turcicus]|uniref:Lipoprotein n=1 Tax=Helicobacter turcicus TaxID=2867412 RepID=A0ABS7JL71_9HELI|nr:hypothetical protein [Helicobacter turcicus]MBX7490138.1 hypothetical protein [Helicobacter turcicus]MBX7544996.1 hypothetical protein [Helicobacter turcicus]
MKKKFLKNACIISALALSGCAQKYDTLPNTRVIQTCHTPIIAYEFGFLKDGEHNDLQISNTHIKDSVEKSLAQSGCFTQAQTDINIHKPYRLDIVYGSINTKNAQGGFFHSQTSDLLIFEIQLSFNKMDETRIAQGKSSLENTNEQYLKVFGQTSTLNNNQIQITLQNAINSAINEIARSFSHDKQQ